MNGSVFVLCTMAAVAVATVAGCFIPGTTPCHGEAGIGRCATTEVAKEAP